MTSNAKSLVDPWKRNWQSSSSDTLQCQIRKQTYVKIVGMHLAQQWGGLQRTCAGQTHQDDDGGQNGHGKSVEGTWNII